MNKRLVCLRVVCVVIFLLLFIFPNFVYSLTDNWLSGKMNSLSTSDVGGVASETDKIMGTAKNVVSIIGKGLAVVMLIVIGIKYMTSAPEGKGEYKKSLIPYVVGAFLVFAAADLVTMFDGGDINEMGESITNKSESVLNVVATVAKLIGYGVAIIALIVLGIKYMTSAPEGKAEFKKTAVPYVIGAIIVFAATQIVSIIANSIVDESGNTNINGNLLIENTKPIIGTIINVITVIGVGTAIITLIVLAIKYITSAPEGKAEFKKTAVPYVVGALVLFASTGIVNIIYEFSKSFGEPGQDYYQTVVFKETNGDTAIKLVKASYNDGDIEDKKYSSSSQGNNEFIVTVKGTKTEISEDPDSTEQTVTIRRKYKVKLNDDGSGTVEKIL